jgi:hypothetical protein
MEYYLLGEYLLDTGKIEPEDIQEALVQQSIHRSNIGEAPLIGDILVDMGVVDQEDVKTALAEQECARLGMFSPALALPFD